MYANRYDLLNGKIEEVKGGKYVLATDYLKLLSDFNKIKSKYGKLKSDISGTIIDLKDNRK